VPTKASYHLAKHHLRVHSSNAYAITGDTFKESHEAVSQAQAAVTAVATRSLKGAQLTASDRHLTDSTM
jgi:hypothetical protein